MRKQVKFQKYEWEQNLRMTLNLLPSVQMQKEMRKFLKYRGQQHWGGKILY